MTNIPQLRESTIFIIGGANDAPSIRIVVGADGKLHIEKVPGWEPEVMREVTAALKAVATTVQLTSRREVQQGIVNSAGAFALQELQSYMAQALPDQQTGAINVVVIAQ